VKILLAGDTHGDISHCQYLVLKALTNECDRVFILGDFGYWEHQKAGVRFLDQLNEYASGLDVPVYFLDGNHDKTSLLMDRYGDLRDEEGFVIVRPHVLYAPRGHRWTWDNGVRFIALGGAYSVDKDWRLQQEELYPDEWPPESLWFPEEEMSDEDMDHFLEDRTQVDVMLAHDKPRSSSPKWNRKDLLECLPNQDRMQRAMRALRPKAYFHGHLHYFYTDEVWYGHDGPTQDMVTTKVMGLLCNPEAGDSTYVNKSLSWQVLDTAATWWR
jgi:predicted phosphodiesterase